MVKLHTQHDEYARKGNDEEYVFSIIHVLACFWNNSLCIVNSHIKMQCGILVKLLSITLVRYVCEG